MVYRGRVQKGVVVFDRSTKLPDGQAVLVKPVAADAPQLAKRPKKLRKGVMKFAGKAKGLPRDASQKVDDYLYGSEDA